MSRHRRRLPLLAVLAAVGWPRDPSRWRVRCRDHNGRRSTVAVRLGNGFVTVENAAMGSVHLSPLQAGRLRDALRGAVLDLDRFAGDRLPEPAETLRPVRRVATERRAVVLRLPTPLTVADIMARLAASGDEQRPAAGCPFAETTPIPRPAVLSQHRWSLAEPVPL